MTLLIRNAEIYDGKGSQPFRGDVFVSGDRVSAIGSIPLRKADVIIDGQGMVVCPGFFDPAAKTDHYFGILDEPAQEEFLRNGVTAVVGGQEGVSLAPAFAGGLKLIEEWSGRHRNIGWHSLKEFLNHLSRCSPGINFGTLVGYDTLRRAFPPLNRALASPELAFLKRSLDEALTSGGLGLSAKWGSDKKYLKEVKALAEVAAHRGRVVVLDSVPPEDVKSALEFAEGVNAPVTLANFLPVLGKEEEYTAALENIAGTQTYFEFTPLVRQVRSVRRFLPEWTRQFDNEALSAALRDDWLRARMLKELPEINPRYFSIVQAPHHDSLVGNTLEDLMAIYRSREAGEALLRLLQSAGPKVLAAYPVFSPGTLRLAAVHPNAILGTSGASFAFTRKPKAAAVQENPSALPYFLSLAMEEGLLSLAAAIRKITSVPAGIFGAVGRGILREGAYADIVGFSPEPTAGEIRIRFVVVNGVLAVKEDELQATHCGRIIKSARR